MPKKRKIHFLITAGGTREYIDPVRFISNASSGKMGYALTRAALKAGHKVTLICAPTNLRPPNTAKIINVQTSKDMFLHVKENFKDCDCLIMAAAVSDYTPAKSSKKKIQKRKENLTIELKPTTDILEWAAKHKKCKNKKAKQKKRIVIGFALEDQNVQKRAEKKLNEKKLDMIIANTPTAIGADRSTVYIKSKNSAWVKIENASNKTHCPCTDSSKNSSKCLSNFFSPSLGKTKTYSCIFIIQIKNN